MNIIEAQHTNYNREIRIYHLDIDGMRQEVASAVPNKTRPSSDPGVPASLPKIVETIDNLLTTKSPFSRFLELHYSLQDELDVWDINPVGKGPIEIVALIDIVESDDNRLLALGGATVS